MAASLAVHADGSRPIGDPQRLLLKHTGWMVQEYRKEHHAGNREVPVSDVAMLEAAVEDIGRDLSYAMLVEAMANDVELAYTIYFSGPDGGKISWAQYLGERLPSLQRVFEVAAPPEIADEVRRMGEDDRVCVPLGVFPLRMPPSAVATYREAQGVSTSTTEEATRQRIARLRYRLASAWPRGSAPDVFLRDPRLNTRRGEDRHGSS